jgi:hypothetical protein
MGGPPPANIVNLSGSTLAHLLHSPIGLNTPMCDGLLFGAQCSMHVHRVRVPMHKPSRLCQVACRRSDVVATTRAPSAVAASSLSFPLSPGAETFTSAQPISVPAMCASTGQVQMHVRSELTDEDDFGELVKLTQALRWMYGRGIVLACCKAGMWRRAQCLWTQALYLRRSNMWL